jgi:hypothetical protein
MLVPVLGGLALQFGSFLQPQAAGASKLGAAADSAWEAMGGGPADLTFPDNWLGVWDVTSTLVSGSCPCCVHPPPQRSPLGLGSPIREVSSAQHTLHGCVAAVALALAAAVHLSKAPTSSAPWMLINLVVTNTVLINGLTGCICGGAHRCLLTCPWAQRCCHHLTKQQWHAHSRRTSTSR